MYTRGLGAMSSQACRASSACSAFEDVVCYGPGYFTEFCSQWRGGIDPPPSVKPPTIDTTPGSPTYGQAMIDGHVVDTVGDAQRLIDEQQIQQIRDWQAQNQASFDSMGSYWTIPGIANFSGIPNPFGGIDFLPVALLIGGVALVSFLRH